MSLFSSDLPHELNIEIFLYLDPQTLQTLNLLTLTPQTPQLALLQQLLADPSIWIQRSHKELNLQPGSFWTRSPVEAALPLPTTTECQKAYYRYLELVSRKGATYGSSLFLSPEEIIRRSIRADNLPLAQFTLRTLQASQEPEVYDFSEIYELYLIDHPSPNPETLAYLQSHLTHDAYDPEDVRCTLAGIKGQLLDDPFDVTDDYVYQLAAHNHFEVLDQYIKANQSAYDRPTASMYDMVVAGAIYFGDARFLSTRTSFGLLFDDLAATRRPLVLHEVLNVLETKWSRKQIIRFIDVLVVRALNKACFDNLKVFYDIAKERKLFNIEYSSWVLSKYDVDTLEALRGNQGLLIAEWLVSYGIMPQNLKRLDPAEEYERAPYVYHAVKAWLLN